MTTLNSMLKTSGALAALAMLAACGGGADPATPAAAPQQFVAQMRAHALAAPPARAVTTSDTVLTASAAATADMVLDWAEFKFPDLFPKAVAQRFPAVVFQGVVYNARAYSGPWGTRYLGITADGRVFGLGDFTNQQLQAYDTVAFWSPQVLADWCAFDPAGCQGNPPAGALNVCALPAAQALATGRRVTATYAVTGLSTGRYTVDSEVDGLASFQNQNAVKLTTRTNGSETTAGVTTAGGLEIASYVQDAGNGFVRSLGSEFTTIVSGEVVNRSTIVNTPPVVNVEFSLAVGQSLAVSTTSVVSTGGMTFPPSTSSLTYSFLARESVTVGARSFDACRYSQTDAGGSFTTTYWIAVGTDVVVRSRGVNNATGQVERQEDLVDAAVNGQPI